MRTLLLAMLVSIMQAPPPVPWKTSDNQNQDTHQSKNETAEHQSPIAPTPTPEHVTEKAVSEQTSPNNPASPKTEQSVAIRELPPVSVPKDWMDKTSWFFGLALVGVGILGVYAAVRTLRIIERQTIAIEQQTKLQSAQWVALKNWRGEFRQPYMFTVRVDVVNETNFPLTLEGADFRVGTVISPTAENVTLIPGGKYSVGFVHQMLLEEATAYLNNITTFGVRGAIRFSGIGGGRIQEFGGLITASAHDGVSFEARTEYEQSAKEHYREKEPPN